MPGGQLGCDELLVGSGRAGSGQAPHCRPRLGPSRMGSLAEAGAAGVERRAAAGSSAEQLRRVRILSQGLVLLAWGSSVLGCDCVLSHWPMRAFWKNPCRRCMCTGNRRVTRTRQAHWGGGGRCTPGSAGCLCPVGNRLWVPVLWLNTHPALSEAESAF